ncbi:MAG: YqaJ viral recombinase family protein [Treponema sp.]|nr:YqaJ viral recombinase family protein [Treponema sp.]
MENSEWLERRRSFIGGSDTGAVMGLSRYGSPLTVYLEKKGMAQIEENDAMLRGSIMEPYIRQLTQKEFPNMEIEEAAFIFQSKVNLFMGANVDGFIFIDAEQQKELPLSADHITNKCIGLGIHEIKTSQDGYGFSEDEIPDAYYAQVQHYLAVLDLPWAILTVYIISKNKIRHYPIMRDDTFITRLIAAEKDFYDNYLVPGVMPAAMGLDAEEDLITGMFQGGQSTLVLGDAEKRLCADYVEFKASIKVMEEKTKAIANDLKALLIQKAQPGQEMKISAIAGSYSISWSRYNMTRLDTEAIKKAGLYEQYSKKSETGRFSISEKAS